jgi:hypothetical protein
MLPNFLLNASFHSLLISIDQELTEKMREKGCPCGGKLHQSNYPRSPLGIPATLRSSFDERFSLCCDTCRKRITPESVRFFGHRWYPAPLLILISALTLGINDRRLKQVKYHFGISVSESTWKRWRRWWKESFEATSFWQQAKGLAIKATMGKKRLFPRALLILFDGTLEEKLLLLLRFLMPLTGGNLRAV